MNYGFINMNNDANEVMIPMMISEHDQGLEIKLKLINEQKRYQKFRVRDNLEEKIMEEFISFTRYTVYDGPWEQLYIWKEDALNEARKKKREPDSDDSDDQDNKDDFKARNLQALSIENEIKTWVKIKDVCSQQLSQYPTSLEEDLKTLAKDEKEHYLTYNQSNCIKFVAGEKEILWFLINSSDRMIKLLGMSQKEAKKEVNSNKVFENCM